MVEKARTSSEILREEYSWPMTVGQVSKLTGVTVRALQHYDKKKLLCPQRTGENVANNRKLYMPDDLERLKRILVLADYGIELDDMPPILDGERDVADALSAQVEELRARENHLRNLILFARYARIVGGDPFETLAFGTSQVDAFAEALRETPFFECRSQRWQALDEEGLERMTLELGSIIVEFLQASSDDSFADIERAVHRLRAWFCEFYFDVDDLDLLNVWMLFADGSEEAEFASEVGDESTPGFLQASVFLVWLKSMIDAIAALAIEYEGGDTQDLLAQENGIVRLVGFVCRVSGYPVQEAAELNGAEWDEMVEYFDTVMGYFAQALSDKDIVELIDPLGRLELDAAFFADAARAAQEVKLFD